MKFLSAFLAILLLLLPAPARAAAIVQGSVADILGIGVPWARIQFTPLSNPQAESGVIITSQPKTIASTADGLFSVPLEQGDYVVVIAGRDTFQISVPNTTNTYILQDLITTSLAYSYSQTPASGPADWYGAAVVLNTSTSNALRSSITALSGSSGSGLTTTSNALRSSITANTASITTTSNVLRSDLTTVSNYALTTINSSSNLLQLQIDGITTSTNTSYSLTSTSNALRSDITTLQSDLTTTSNALRSGISANTASITSTSNTLRSDLTTVSNYALTSINSSSNLLQLQIDGISGSTNYSAAITTTSNALRSDITTLQGDLTTTSNALRSDLTTASNALRSDIAVNASGITTSSNALQVQIDGISGSTNYANLVTTTSNALRSDITANASAITTTSNALQSNLSGIATNLTYISDSYIYADLLLAGDITTTSNALQLQIDAVSGGTNYAAAITTTSNVLRSDITANTSAITTTSNVLQADLVSTTRWVATAASLPSSTNAVVFTAGYLTAGDGGHGTYRRDAGSSAATNGVTVHMCSAGGRYLLAHDGVISSKLAGLVGDNSTDDRPRFAALLTAATGYTVRLAPATYRCVGGLTVGVGTRVEATGATVRCETTGLDRAVDMLSYSSWRGGTVICERQSGGVNGNDHCAFRLGDYATGIGATNVVIRDVVVEAKNFGSNAIFITGASERVLVENVYHPSSSTLNTVVLAHWNSNFSLNITNGTFHPHDIVIRNITSGSLTAAAADATPVIISAGYNILVENVTSDQCRSASAYYAGDYGFKYSYLPSDIMGGVVFRNVGTKKATAKGLFAYGYQELTDPTCQPVVFENCTVVGPWTEGSLSGSTIYGIYPDQIRNVTFRNCTVRGFQFGVKFGNGCEQILFEGGVYSDNRICAFRFDNSTTKNVSLNNVSMQRNGWGAAGASATGIYADAGSEVQIRGCWFGHPVAEIFQECGALIHSPAASFVFSGNHTVRVKSGGVNYAYNLGNSTHFGHLHQVGENTAASGITVYSGPLNVPVMQRGAGRIFRGTGIPTFGTYVVGDIVLADSPVFGPWFWSCSVAGTPGTWVSGPSGNTFGAVVDANFTYTPGSTSALLVVQSATPLTADRTLTLSTTGATAGMRVQFTRLDNGAYNFSFAGKNVPANAFASAVYDGAAWRLTSYGTL